MKVKKFETNFKRNMHFAKNEVNFKETNKNHEKDLINIYPEVEYQDIIGFGGAFTEAGRICFDRN